ncbi:MAG TPA: hypothetical protein VNA13_04725 [Xanthomonadales bacterium]|nr:hypothetical protein [Xanthomonadales bacterium]
MQLVELIPIIFALILSLFALSLSLSFLFGPPYLPTPKRVIKEMLDLTKVAKGDVVIDLGSGDGVVLIEAALRGADARGWEINPFLVLWTRIRARIKNLHNKISVYAKPYQKANLQGASVIFCYNMPQFMHLIKKKLYEETSENVKIVSFKFPIPGLSLIKETPSGIYLYSLKK